MTDIGLHAGTGDHDLAHVALSADGLPAHGRDSCPAHNCFDGRALAAQDGPILAAEDDPSNGIQHRVPVGRLFDPRDDAGAVALELTVHLRQAYHLPDTVVGIEG